MKKTTKIGIIGAGHVGSHVASSLMTQGLCDEIVLLDTDEGKARRHADDIADSVAYMPLPAKIYAGGYEALADADRDSARAHPRRRRAACATAGRTPTPS